VRAFVAKESSLFRLFRAFAVSCSCLLAGCARQSPAAPAGLFQDVAGAAGMRFRHSNGAAGQFYLIETTGSGCALFDYDNDGLLDAFLVQSGPLPGRPGPRRNALYHNNGGSDMPHFTDATTGSG